MLELTPEELDAMLFELMLEVLDVFGSIDSDCSKGDSVLYPWQELM